MPWKECLNLILDCYLLLQLYIQKTNFSQLNVSTAWFYGFRDELGKGLYLLIIKRVFHQNITPGKKQCPSEAHPNWRAPLPAAEQVQLPGEHGLPALVPPELLLVPICSRSECVWRENWRLYLESRRAWKEKKKIEKSAGRPHYSWWSAISELRQTLKSLDGRAQ